MKKKKPAFDTSALGEMSPDLVLEHNRKSREAANPLVRSMMDEVDMAIEQENSRMDAQFEAEQAIRKWAKDLLGFEISMNQIDELKRKMSEAKNGSILAFQGIALVKTQFGTFDRADRYLYALERTILDLTSKSVRQEFTDHSFSDLMKLAFKRLFKRSK